MMLSNLPILSIAIWCPVVFGVLVFLFGRDDKPLRVRLLSLCGSMVSFLVTLPLIANFDNAAHGMQFVEKFAWIERFNIFYHFGVDGISLWFVPLTAFMTVIVVIASWQANLPDRKSVV